MAVNTISRRNASQASTPSPNVDIVLATVSVFVTIGMVGEARVAPGSASARRRHHVSTARQDASNPRIRREAEEQ
jgi:hypothetical protein